MKILLRTAIFLISLFSAPLWSQESASGFVKITTDSVNIPVFVDNHYIGMSPMDEYIPVRTGFHRASLLPPESETPLLRERLPESSYEFYLGSGDTLDIYLVAAGFEEQVRALAGESIYSQILGWIMMGILVYTTMTVFN